MKGPFAHRREGPSLVPLLMALRLTLGRQQVNSEVKKALHRRGGWRQTGRRGYMVEAPQKWERGSSDWERLVRIQEASQ